MALLITDPIDWGLVLDANGNLDFPPPGSNIDASSGLAAVVQGARIRLALTAGEWFLNLDRGVARFKRDGVEPTRVIFGAKFSVARAQREYRNALLGGNGIEGVPGLSSLVRLDVRFDSDSRTQFIDWQGRTVWGDTEPDLLVLPIGGS